LRALAGLAAFVALAAQAGEVTVIRPTAFIGAESPYYVMLDGKLASDLESREHVRFNVAPGRHVLAVRCPKGMFSTYAETRRPQDFGAGPAFFVVEPSSDCVTITPVDARAAAPLLANTRLRPAETASTYTEGAVEASTPAAALAPAVAAPAAAAKDEIGAATAAWIDAFNSRDPARLTSLYDPEAVLIGTSARQPAAGSAAIAAYFRDAPKRPMDRVALGEHTVRVYGDVAIDSGLYNFFQVSDGKAAVTPARYTFVYRKRDGKWLIVEHHSSRVP
jgi:uncharacterized protein (TIGR02246 family)